MSKHMLEFVIDAQSAASVADTPDSRLALVFLHSDYSSVVTQRPVKCTIPFFVDTAWTARELARVCHTQAALAHGLCAQTSKCPFRSSTEAHFFADRATANPLLGIKKQAYAVDLALAVGRLPPTPTSDGARAAPNDDPLFDVSIGKLVALKYLTAEPVHACMRFSLLTEARDTPHAPPMCVGPIRAFDIGTRQYDLACRSNRAACRCLPCGCLRLRRLCDSHPRLDCRQPKCWCIFRAALERTTSVLRLNAVPGTYDVRSELYSERVFDTGSALVRRYLASQSEANQMAMHYRYEVLRARTLGLLCPEPPVGLACRHFSYSEARRQLGGRTIGAGLALRRAFDVQVLRAAKRWLAGPIRHFVDVAISGFEQYGERVYATARAGDGELLPVTCERSLYDELSREPNGALAVARVFAFEPLAPRLERPGETFNSTTHDDLVSYAIVIVHIVAAVETLWTTFDEANRAWIAAQRGVLRSQ